RGRQLLEVLNAVNMMVLNGVRSKAKFTSFQSAGSATIDLIWTREKALHKVRNLTEFEDQISVDSDHHLILVDLVKQFQPEMMANETKVQKSEGRLTKIQWKRTKNGGAWQEFKNGCEILLTKWNTVNLDGEEG